MLHWINVNYKCKFLLVKREIIKLHFIIFSYLYSSIMCYSAFHIAHNYFHFLIHIYRFVKISIADKRLLPYWNTASSLSLIAEEIYVEKYLRYMIGSLLYFNNHQGQRRITWRSRTRRDRDFSPPAKRSYDVRDSTRW